MFIRVFDAQGEYLINPASVSMITVGYRLGGRTMSWQEGHEHPDALKTYSFSLDGRVFTIQADDPAAPQFDEMYKAAFKADD